MSIYADVQVTFEVEPGRPLPMEEPINGTINLKPKRDFGVDIMGYRLILEIKGKIQSVKRVLLQRQILTNTRFEEGKEYNFPIRIFNDTVETYRGHHVECLLKLETYLNLDDDTHQESKDAGLKARFSVKEMIWGEQEEKIIEYLEFLPSSTVYKVLDSKIELLAKGQKQAFGYGFGMLVIMFIGVAWGLYTWYHGLLGLAIALSVLVLYHLIQNQIIGRLSVQLQNQEGYFTAKISSSTRWQNIRNVEAYYQIMEQVVDKRGTSTSTYTKAIYKSESSTINFPKYTPTVKLKFPEKKPMTMKYGDFSIYWELVLRVQTSYGIRFKYIGTIKVGETLEPISSINKLQ